MIPHPPQPAAVTIFAPSQLLLTTWQPGSCPVQTSLGKQQQKCKCLHRAQNLWKSGQAFWLGELGGFSGLRSKMRLLRTNGVILLCYFFIARIREIPAAPEELRLGVSLSTQALQAGSESGDLWPFELHLIYLDASKKQRKTLALWGQFTDKSAVSTTDSFSLKTWSAHGV